MMRKQGFSSTRRSFLLAFRRFSGLRKFHRMSSAILPLVFVSSSLIGQESLTLFGAIDSDDANTQNRVETPRVGSSDTAPVFSLVGTTRIGKQRSILLQHATGETVSLQVETGELQTIPSYENFSATLSASGAVQVQYPSSRVCLPFEGLGVVCDPERNRAELTIAKAAPLSVAEVHRSNDLQTSEDNESGDLAFVDDPDGEPSNPFEALRQRAARGQRGEVVNPDEQGRRFRPRRIEPDQVPPGKRVVSTPFGDRLVDI